MNPLRTLWAWIAAGIEWTRGRGRAKPEGEDLAQRLDHCLPAARRPDELAEPEELGSIPVAQPEELVAEPGGLSPPVAQPEELAATAVAEPGGLSPPVAQPEELAAEPGGLSPPVAQPGGADVVRQELAPHLEPGTIVATNLRVDTATWEIRCAREWPKWRELTQIASSGQRTVEWVDVFGEVVELVLDRGKPGSGTLVLSTGTTRIEIRRSRAEIQISSLASEVEGVEAWGLRWLPRWVWWLRGKALRSSDWRDLGADLRSLGVKTRRIEPCVDLIGLQIQPGDERALVSRASKWARWRDDGGLDGFGAGERSKSPHSIGIYDKLAKLAASRGPSRAALIGSWRAKGWREGVPVTRVEPRLWGEALRLEGLDASDPTAPFDSNVVELLFRDSLSRHRMVDLAVESSRLRDRPDLPWWELARAASGSAEPLRLQRDVVKLQADAIEQHAMRRLGRAGADVEVLLDGTGDGAKALDALGRLIRGPDWMPDTARAHAQYDEILAQAIGDEAQ